MKNRSTSFGAITYACAAVLLIISGRAQSQDFLYGLTQFGGINNKGVPYQISTTGSGFISYTDFDGDNGERPGAGAGFTQLLPPFGGAGFVALTELGDQNLGLGNRVQIIPGQGGLIKPFSFHFSINGTGTNPSGKFLAASSGVLYGMTPANGQYGGGAIFSMPAVAGSGAQVLVGFDGPSRGKSPKGSLIEASNGRFYGMTELGGVNDLGVIFSVNSSSDFIKILDFNGTNGSNPTGNLVLGNDGRLYGMTKNGGANGKGVIFSLALDGTNYAKLYDFNVVSGGTPYGSLTQFTDGKLYGLTSGGGINGLGTIFSITPAGQFTKILDFNGDNGNSPLGDLLVSPDGTVMYAVTYSGGSNNRGVLFKLENGTSYTKLYDYQLATGSNPVGVLAMQKQEATITFPPMPELTTLSPPFTPQVATSSNLPVYFASSDPSVAIIENNQVKIVGAGGVQIRAFQLGDHAYLAQSATQVLSVKKADQAITFAPISPRTYGGAPFSLTATSTSGLPVTLASDNPSVATVAGNTVTIRGGGIANIVATQNGDATFGPAPMVAQQFNVNRADQTINFSPTPVRICCQTFDLTATSSSGLEVLFKTPDREYLEFYGSSVQPLKLGTVDIIAYQPGNNNYNPFEVHAEVSILKGDQSITFQIGSGPFKFGDPASFINGTSTSGLPVTFKSEPPGIAVVEGSSLYFLGIGTTIITATQNGNGLYNAATPVVRSVTVGPPTTSSGQNVISWSDLLPKAGTSSPFNLTASASSGLPVSYSSSNTAVAEIVGNLVTVRGIGSTIITATQGGDATYSAATPVQKTLLVEKEDQYFYLPSLDNVTFGADPTPLPLVTNRGLAIEYSSSDNSVVSIENYLLHYNGSGSAIITSSQPGDENYLPLVPASRSVNVSPKYQTVTFDPLTPKKYGDTPFELQATASSGYPVTFSSSNPALASIDDATITINGAGMVTITATQSGFPGYYFTEVHRDLIIDKASQSITFLPLPDRQFGDAPFEITATSSVGLPVVFSSAKPSVAKTTGNLVVTNGNGTADIIASQPGNDNYAPAEDVHQLFTVADADLTYDIAGATYGGGPNSSGVVYTMDSEGNNFSEKKHFAERTVPSPKGGFIKGTDGRMYANFSWGGKYNLARIVRLEADGTGFTELYSFDKVSGNSPWGNLSQADNGDLFGITRSGGTNGSGTIFSIGTDGANFKVLYNFGTSSGGSPMGGLMQASNGKLYGMTQSGAFFSSGTIFSINTDGTDFSIIFYINNGNPVNSGSSPRGDLIQGADGFLYGLMSSGGTGTRGTLFKIKPDGSGYLKLIDFDGPNFGAAPGSTLLLGSDGKLYGMTQFGGANNQGTLFSINTDGTSFARLLDFNIATHGAYPLGELMEGSNGLLFGMTNAGGANNLGTVFSINKNGTGFQKIKDFDTTASTPFFGPLIEMAGGTLFGMTSSGGPSNGGVIFSVTPAGDFNVVKDFPQEESGPWHLVSDLQGEYYFGITANGGQLGDQSIFRIRASDGAYERTMSLPEGSFIYKILFVSTGHLWCTGAMNGQGYMFRIKPDGSEFLLIPEFNNAGQGVSKWIIESSDGYIFGTTGRTSNSAGVIFKIKNDGTGYTKVLDMPAGTELTPGALVETSDGNFYVATAYNSSLYRFDASGTLTKVFTFPSDAGEMPMKIIELNGGSLGIITRDHGSGGAGSIFSVEPDGSSYTRLFDPQQELGVNPVDMVQTTDGWIYVTAQFGGANDKGIIYKVRGDGSSYTKVREFSGVDGDVPSALIFKKEQQSFTFDNLPGKKTSDPPFVPTASSSSGARVQFFSSNPEIAVVENGRIKPVAVGTTTITARLPASTNFFKASDISRQLTVSKGNQTIIFGPLASVYVDHLPFELMASSSSGLPIIYSSSNSAIATIDGNLVTINGPGVVVITATQPGNVDFFPAAGISQELVVLNGGAQTIQFTNPGTQVLGNPPIALVAAASSGLPVQFSTSSERILLNGSVVTLLEAGPVTVVASQPGSQDFSPAEPVQVTFCINPTQPALTMSGTAPNFVLHSSNSQGNQWYVNGVLLAGQTSSNLSVDVDGSYTVVTTIDVCASEPAIPLSLITTGIEKIDDLEIKIYPNPTGGDLQVEITTPFSGHAALELIDGVGHTIEKRLISESHASVFDFGPLPTGLYYMRISLNGKTLIRKISKY